MWLFFLRVLPLAAYLKKNSVVVAQAKVNAGKPLRQLATVGG